MKRALLILVAYLVSLLHAGCVSTGELVILHYNDFHGQVKSKLLVQRPGRAAEPMGGYPALERLVREHRARHEKVWVTDAGDWFQGTPEGNEDKGRSVMACMNRLGLTAAAVGNHEFDFGEASLIEVIKTAQHPVLAANIFEGDSDRLRPYVKPYIVEDVHGVRVAIVGLVTADTRNVSTGPFGRADFRDEISTVRDLWPELERKADAVVLLTHCGLATDIRLAKAFPKLVLILGGHSHTTLRRPHRVGRTWIVQSGSRATAVSRVVLVADRRRRTLDLRSARLIDVPAARSVDSDTGSFLSQQFAHIGPRWDVPIGRIGGARDRRTGPGSTPGGNLVADLIREAGEAQLGLTNKGGLRTVLPQGPITRRQAFEFLPFENSVATFELTGTEIEQILAHGLLPGRRPLEIAGGSYKYRIVGGERQLVGVFVGGRPLRDEQVYRVATNSFIAGGGDGFSVFARRRPKKTNPAMLRDLLEAALAHETVLALPGEARIHVLFRTNELNDKNGENGATDAATGVAAALLSPRPCLCSPERNCDVNWQTASALLAQRPQRDPSPRINRGLGLHHDHLPQHRRAAWQDRRR